MKYFNGSTEELIAIRTKDVLDGMLNGGGDEEGLGKNPNAAISMTAATECYYGSSGRGSSIAKAHIRFVARLGYLNLISRGRNEYIMWTEKGLKYAEENLNKEG